ncbi:dihydrodipicolinate synthase family protein [Mycolicibacterium sp. P1-18]|uniref:dihydrodipicolinate synthase family protein n=1 Tax=Mycolicibacterium sp. P1-18 TaxID=2024615 RepID=UPI0011F140EA|nr:dihydrodipicolinate synthase family protein [Mycolicibacterium sp. P1-18]KAA0098982.1 dihydrodipicolinate synthase family protein [Mycolicibacterium sp. P1-18]
MDFTGVITPLLTPFTEDGGTIDEGALRNLVDSQIEDGASGLIPCGTTGEFSALSNAERRRVTEVVVDQAAGRVPVMAQPGSTSTEEVLGLSEHAQEVGAAGLLLPPPYYGSLTDEEIFGFYAEIAGSTDVPICLYNIPAATGIGMSVDLIIEIAREVDNVKYVKDSSGDLTQQATFLLDHPDDIVYLCGEELLVAPGLLLGLRGAVLGCANIIGRGMVQLLAAGAAGDAQEVSRINRELTPLMRFIVSNPYSATVKEALRMEGMPVGPVRRPLRPLNSAQRSALELELKSIDPEVLTSRTQRA